MLAAALVGPLMPQFCRQMAISRSLLGATQSIFGVMQTLSTPVLGLVSDKIGRRPVLMISALGMALSYLCLIYASVYHSVVVFIASRFIIGGVRQTMAISSGLLTETCTEGIPEGKQKEHLIAKAMSLLSFFGTAAYIVGPALGGYLADTYGKVTVVVIAAVLATVNAAAMFLCAPSTRQAKERVAAAADGASPKLKQSNTSTTSVLKGRSKMSSCSHLDFADVPMRPSGLMSSRQSLQDLSELVQDEVPKTPARIHSRTGSMVFNGSASTPRLPSRRGSSTFDVIHSNAETKNRASVAAVPRLPETLTPSKASSLKKAASTMSFPDSESDTPLPTPKKKSVKIDEKVNYVPPKQNPKSGSLVVAVLKERTHYTTLLVIMSLMNFAAVMIQSTIASVMWDLAKRDAIAANHDVADAEKSFGSTSGLIFGASNALATISILVAPWWIKKWHSCCVVAVSIFASCAGLLMQSMAQNMFTLIMGIMLDSAFADIADTINKSTFTTHFPSKRVGEVMSIVYSIDGINRIIAPLLGSYLMTAFDSICAPAVVGTAASVLSFLIYYLHTFRGLSKERVQREIEGDDHDPLNGESCPSTPR